MPATCQTLLTRFFQQNYKFVRRGSRHPNRYRGEGQKGWVSRDFGTCARSFARAELQQGMQLWSINSHGGVQNEIRFPSAVPEVPVRNIADSAAYYRSSLGFTLDWSD